MNKMFSNVITPPKKKFLKHLKGKKKITYNSDENKFVDPKLMNTTYPEKWGFIYPIFYQKITMFKKWYVFHKISKMKLQAI